MFEYRLRKEAHRLMDIDEEHHRHWQAWLNWNVQATKKEGKKIKPVFGSFKEFFDYEKLCDRGQKTEIKSGKKEGIIDILKKQKERSKQNGKL